MGWSINFVIPYKHQLVGIGLRTLWCNYFECSMCFTVYLFQCVWHETFIKGKPRGIDILNYTPKIIQIQDKLIVLISSPGKYCQVLTNFTLEKLCPVTLAAIFCREIIIIFSNSSPKRIWFQIQALTQIQEQDSSPN